MAFRLRPRRRRRLEQKGGASSLAFSYGVVARRSSQPSDTILRAPARGGSLSWSRLRYSRSVRGEGDPEGAAVVRSSALGPGPTPVSGNDVSDN